MYAFIKGTLNEVAPDHVVVENNGIGYMIFVPATADSAMPREGETVLLYTHFSASENGVFLYGFFTKEERRMFLSLTGISGVGPKAAMSILSSLSLQELMIAIINDDEKAISRAPGIGAKTAKRIILELKDKMEITEEDLLGEEIVPRSASETGSVSEAVMALTALGFAYGDASRAVKSIENAADLDVESLISLALKEL